MNFWRRFRDRKSREAINAFTMGMIVGRHLCLLAEEHEFDKIIKRITEEII